MDIFDSTDIQSAGRLDRDQNFRLLRDLPADNDLLLVAARKSAGLPGAAVLGTDIIGFDQFLGKGAHFLSVDAPSGRELFGAVLLHNRIFIYGEAKDQAVLMAVRRNGRQTVVYAVFGIPVLDLLTAHKDLSLALFEVVDSLHEFMLAVSVNTGDTDDLTCPDLQVKVLDSVDPLFVFDIQVLDIQNNFSGVRRCLVNHKLDCMTHHHGCQLILCDTLHRYRIDIFTAPDNGAHIRRSLDLFELVRDDDDGLAVFDQVLHDREQFIDLLLRQNCCGLIQNQDLRTAVESFEDFDSLLHTDRNVPYALIRIDFQSVFFDNFKDILTGLSHVKCDRSVGRLGTQDNVLGYCKVFHQHKVLVNHTNAVFNCSGRIFYIHLFSVDVDFPLIRLVKAVEDVHQRTFSGAVLTEDRVDRSTLHVEIDIRQCIEGTKALGNSMHLYSIFTADFCRHIYLPLFQRFLVCLKLVFGCGRDDRASFDLLADFNGGIVDLVGIVLVVLRNADCVICKTEPHILAADLASCDMLSGDQVHGDIHVLEGGCQHIVRRQICLITVDADSKFVHFSCCLDNTGTRTSCCMIDDITAVGEHLVGNTLALGRVRKALRILGSHSYILAKYAVGIGDAGFISVLELIDDFAGDTSHKTDFLRLGDCCCNISDHKGRFLCAEHNAGQVWCRVAECIVHAGKGYVRISRSRLDDRVRTGKSDAPAQCIAVVDQRLKVGHKVAGLFGLNIIDIRPCFLLQMLQAFPGALVEGLVIDAAGICDHGDLPAGPVHIGEIIGLPEQIFYRSLFQEYLKLFKCILVSGRSNNTCLDLLAALKGCLIDSVRIIAVILGDADCSVSKSEGERLSADLHACDMALGNRIDSDIDILQGRCQHVLGGKICLITVNTDRIFACLSGSLDDACACAAGRMIDDVTAVGEHLVGNTLALGRVGETLRILRGYDDILFQNAVGIFDTRLVTIFKLIDDITGNTAHKTDFAGRRDSCRNIADHKGGLLCTEHDACNIIRSVSKSIIHTCKVYIRIGLGSFEDSIRARKADAPAQGISIIYQRLKVGREISALLGLNIGDLRPCILLQLLKAFPGALVKGLVVNAAGIGDHSDLPAGPIHVFHSQING